MFRLLKIGLTSKIGSELNKTLIDLNTLANASTRRLDNSYYAVLEKLAALQEAIASLKDLTLQTRAVNEHFETGSKALVEQVDGQLDAFAEFQAQEQKIGKLKGRIMTGREKVQVLGDRLAVVQERVKKWARLEKEWQQSMRQRLKVLWGVMAILAIIMISFLIFHFSYGKTDGPAVLHGFTVNNLSTKQQTISANKIINDTMSLRKSTGDGLAALRNGIEARLDDDPRINAFDEL